MLLVRQNLYVKLPVTYCMACQANVQFLVHGLKEESLWRRFANNLAVRKVGHGGVPSLDWRSAKLAGAIDIEAESYLLLTQCSYRKKCKRTCQKYSRKLPCPYHIYMLVDIHIIS